jgi:hypothetical protein
MTTVSYAMGILRVAGKGALIQQSMRSDPPAMWICSAWIRPVP